MKIKPKEFRRLVRVLSASLVAATSLVPLQAGTYSNNFNTDPGAAVTLDGSAKWVDAGGGAGYISLTEPVNDQHGLMIVPDFDNGELIGGFTATFKAQVGPGSGNAADGWSFNWGTDLPTTASGELEEGIGSGLRVAFDIYDNGNSEAPSIDVKVGGATIAQKKMTKADIMTSGFADVKVELKNGLLSVDYKGQSVFASIPAGLAPQAGASFGFGARTGGENAAQYIDELNITTFPPTEPTVTTFRNNAKGFLIKVVDAPNAAVDVATVSATVDGAAVTGSATKTGDTTTFTFTNPNIYTAGTTHNVVLTYKYGASATTVNVPLSFTVGAYTSIPASAALAAGVIDTSKRGFIWRVHQVDDGGVDLPNTLSRTENQLGGLLGANVADPAAVGGADAASTAPTPANAPIQFTVSNVINFTDSGADTGSMPGDTAFPGIPGLTASDDSIAGEVLTAIEFPAAGVYRLVVNSDDGFRTTMGKDPRDPSNPVLGFFEGGRGPADSPFEVYIPAAGIYPMRTIWEEGGGGAALEIFSQLLDGTRVLLNDTTTDARALKTYQLPASLLGAYLSASDPANKAVLITRPKTIEAHLLDAGTTVTANSVSLKLNGATVPITSSVKTDGDTKVIATPTTDLLANTLYTAELTFTDSAGTRTVSWTFTTGPLSGTLFVIEAEDFDYSTDGVTGGLHNPKKGEAGLDVDVMPYYGGAYDGLSAIQGVDYNDDDPSNGAVYRTEDRGSADGNDVSMYLNTGNAPGNGLGGNLPIAGNDRGTYKVTTTYELGWSGGDWFNYTREFPDNGKGGWWEVYISLSYGGADAGQLSATLARVTDGVGTTAQTTENLGSFSGPGSGNWGQNNLVPMRNASGAKAVVKLQGLQTIRASINSGDYDFIMFSAANPPPPSIDQSPLDSVKRDAAIFDWVLKDGGSLVNVSTVKVMLNNQDVTSQATVTKTATGATIHLDLSGTLQPAGELPWTITFNDNSPTPQTVTGSGTVVVNPYPTPGVFVIEAEDFNYSTDDINGGLTNPQKGIAGLDVDVMPYLGGAYDLDPTDPTVGELSAIEGVDYNNDDGNDSNVYRSEKDPNGENEVNITAANGNRYSNDRGTFTTTSNYRIGWVGGSDWANYTRTFPTNDYTVWAALSYDGRGGSQLRGALDLVTSDPTKPNQATTRLGTFDAVGSGGWGRNELVPMKTNGVIATVHLGGVQTVRYNMPSGDFDYLLFVPTTSTPVGPKFTKYVVNANGSITIEWTGGGVLEATPALVPNATWTPVQGATSPYTFTPQPGVPMLFARIRAPATP